MKRKTPEPKPSKPIRGGGGMSSSYNRLHRSMGSARKRLRQKGSSILNRGKR